MTFYTTHLCDTEGYIFEDLWRGAMPAVPDGSGWAETDCILFVERILGKLTLRCVTAQVRRIPERDGLVLVLLGRFYGATDNVR